MITDVRLSIVMSVAMLAGVQAYGDDGTQQRASQEPEEETQRGGYPEEPRAVGGPTDVSRDLATSFPKLGSVFDRSPFTQYFEWKERLYEKTGLKLSLSYQGSYQHVSDIVGTEFPLPGGDADWASGGWLLTEFKWDAFNKGADWQGGITAALDWRHTFGDIEPTVFQTQTGSQWPTEWTIVAWDPWFAMLFWEQWAQKEKLVFRVGTQTAVQTIDFFRFKDGRNAFSSAQMTLPSTTMPWPAPGLGAMFEWWPVEDNPLYVIGTINDMNADPGGLSWNNAWEYGQFFYAVEVGAHLGDFPTNFDHVHATFYYADERATQAGGSAVFPNKAGWGFRLAGEKQWGRTVGFANYGYNTAEGGYFGITIGEQGLNAGVARQRPFDIRGEMAVSASWGKPIQEFETGPPVWNNRRDQYGVEAYWKILLTPDLWITPNVQMIWNPTFNVDKQFITVGGFKFRWFI